MLYHININQSYFLSYILAIETANPRYFHTQKEFSEFYGNAIPAEDLSSIRKINLVAHKSGINTRYSVIPDYSGRTEEYLFYPKNKSLEPIPMLGERMSLFRKEGLQLSLDAINKIENLENIKSKITHIITVTCTGLYAPGLDIELVDALSLDPSSARSSINFMGCNAAVLALKQADDICGNNKDALVLIVCTELCTIHFQKSFEDDYILSNLLFGDGSAAVLVGSDNNEISEKYHPVRIENFNSFIINEGRNDMAWQISEKGFLMNLTSYVSPLLNRHLPELMNKMQISKNDINHWAIHPGGKKIVDDFCKTLDLPADKFEASYKTLEDYGNMSSPTVLFVLKYLLENSEFKKDENIFLAAFGPGLSIETALLTYA